jgi:hypothetical protein
MQITHAMLDVPGIRHETREAARWFFDSRPFTLREFAGRYPNEPTAPARIYTALVCAGVLPEASLWWRAAALVLRSYQDERLAGLAAMMGPGTANHIKIQLLILGRINSIEIVSWAAYAEGEGLNEELPLRTLAREGVVRNRVHAADRCFYRIDQLDRADAQAVLEMIFTEVEQQEERKQ